MNKFILVILFFVCSFVYGAGSITLNNTTISTLDQQVSSATPKNYFVGRSTVCITLSVIDRNVTIMNSKNSTTDVFIGFDQTISTWTLTNGGICGWSISPGQTWTPIFRGDLYLLNEDLSVSSATVKVLRERNQ